MISSASDCGCGMTGADVLCMLSMLSFTLGFQYRRGLSLPG